MGERGDYVNEMKRCRVCRSRVSPRGSPLSRSCFSSLALPLCRMSDPVSAAPLPAWERHEARRHKQNTDKNTRRAMCWPVSQDSPNPHSLFLLSPFTLSLSLSLIHTHINTESRQRACSLPGTTDNRDCQYYHTCLITWVQSSRLTCGHIFRGFGRPGNQFTLRGSLYSSHLCGHHTL